MARICGVEGMRILLTQFFEFNLFTFLILPVLVQKESQDSVYCTIFTQYKAYMYTKIRTGIEDMTLFFRVRH